MADIYRGIWVVGRHLPISYLQALLFMVGRRWGCRSGRATMLLRWSCDGWRCRLHAWTWSWFLCPDTLSSSVKSLFKLRRNKPRDKKSLYPTKKSKDQAPEPTLLSLPSFFLIIHIRESWHRIVTTETSLLDLKPKSQQSYELVTIIMIRIGETLAAASQNVSLK